jgi:hypothetical protein
MPAFAPAPSPPASIPAPSAALHDSDAVFDDTVKPILVSSCIPCHFPGGKMYGSIPFDDPSVVASHAEGILRRIKAPEKREPLERWLRSVVPR